MSYNDLILTVMTYFGFLTMLLFLGGGFYLFRKANRILDKLDRFYGYIIEEEIKIRDE